MQLFPCPFCGNRDETEFSFAGEAGKVRPEPAPEISAETWSGFLHRNRNPRGATREIWVHLTCGEYFLMERDTVTHAVHGSTSLRKASATATATPTDGQVYGSLEPGAESQAGGAPL